MVMASRAIATFSISALKKASSKRAAPGIATKAERIGQGRENARQFLINNADLCNSIDADLRQLLGLTQLPRKAPEFELQMPAQSKTRGPQIPDSPAVSCQLMLTCVTSSAQGAIHSANQWPRAIPQAG